MAARLLAVLAIVAVAFVVTGTDLPDPDIWWNVADGLVRLRTGGEDLSIFGAHGCNDALPLVTALSSRGLALAWQLGGMWGLVVVRALLVAVVALAAFVGLSRVPLVERTAWAACAAAALALRASARPELFGLALFAILCAAAARLIDDETTTLTTAATTAAPVSPAAAAQRRRGRIVACALLIGCQALWVWSHPLFVLGPAIGAAVVVAALTGSLVAALQAARAQRGGGRTPLRLTRLVHDARPALLVLGCICAGFLARPSAIFGYVQARDDRAFAVALGFREYMSPWLLWQSGWRPPAIGALALLAVAALVAAACAARVGSWRRALSSLFVLLPLLALGLDVMRALVLFVCAAALVLAPLDEVPRRARRLLAATAAVVSLLIAGMHAIDDPLLFGARPPAFAPSRLTPLGPAAFLARSSPSSGKPLVFAPLHAGNWLLLTAPVDVVWSGRRTYSRACGEELLAARGGGAAFDVVDGRLAPSWVLALHASEPALVDTLVARGWTLAYIDLRYALFARPQEGKATLLTVDADALQAAETRPLDAATFRMLLTSTCRTLQVAAPAQAAPTCEAVRRLPEGTALDVSFRSSP